MYEKFDMKYNLAAPQGFEPQPAAPEAVVLPLDYGAINSLLAFSNLPVEVLKKSLTSPSCLKAKN